MKVTTTSERLRHIMQKRDLKQVDILKLCKPFCEQYDVKLAKNDLSQYVSGKVTPGQDKLSILGMALNVSETWLMGYDVQPNLQSPTIAEETTTFPVIGEIAAGYDNIALEDWTGDTVEIPNTYLKGRNKDEFFVLEVKGDSMYPQYQDGDKVLILRQSTLNRSGEIGAIIYDGDCATLKKIEFVKGEDWLEMIPLNPEFKPKRIEGTDLEQCRVIGIPKLLIREIN